MNHSRNARIRHATLPLLIGLGLAAAAAHATSAPPPADLAPIAARHQVPGLTAAVDRAGVTTVASAGVRIRGLAPEVTDEDQWHIGSCTKAVTATLLATYVAEGRIAWTATLAEALPDDVALMSDAARTATLADLVRHRAGMPAAFTPDLFRQMRTLPAAEGRRAIVQHGLRTATHGDDGPTPAYSNTGFVVAGAVCERLGGAPWEELVRRRIFAPLSIDGDAGIGFGPPPIGDDVASPAQPAGHAGAFIFRPTTPGADNPAAMGPAGTLHLTMRQWARFTRLHVRGPGLAADDRDALGLTRADYAEMHRPDGEFAAGWVVGTRPWARGDGPGDRGVILRHAGSNTRWYAVAWLAPERDLSVLAVTNLGDLQAASRATDEAVAAMLRAAGGLEPGSD